MMRISRVGACNNHGFTMIELAMVLLVIGIVGAIVIPRVSGVLDWQEMRRSINRVRGTVRYLQAQAALKKKVYRLMLDLDRQVMSVCSLDHLSGDCEPDSSRELPDFSLPTTVRILDVVSPEGTKTREGEAATHFHPTGLAEPSIIHFEGVNKRQMTVVIEPLAGRVKVLDGYVEPEKT